MQLPKLRLNNLKGGLSDQAKEESTKTNFEGPETARWGGGLSCCGWPQKFILSLQIPGIKKKQVLSAGCAWNFAGISPGSGGVQKVCSFAAPL